MIKTLPTFNPTSLKYRRLVGERRGAKFFSKRFHHHSIEARHNFSYIDYNPAKFYSIHNNFSVIFLHKIIAHNLRFPKLPEQAFETPDSAVNRLNS